MMLLWKHSLGGWEAPLRGTASLLQRVGSEGFRHVQFTSLLMARSYWGLLKAWNWWDMIDEHVFLGGVPMFDDFERLQAQGVCAVVNLCAERQDDQNRLQQAHMEYLWLPVMDASPPSLVQIWRGVMWVTHHINAGRAVYIHCAAGMGRSSTLLACWYVYTRGMSVPQVLRFLRVRRPQVTLTRRQIRRLHEFRTLLLEAGPGVAHGS